jgi:diguanylate cyclase (GGDEF)-like protein/PAS domain S-box-containing protein
MKNEGQDHFISLMNASAQGILIHDDNGLILFVNQVYVSSLGYTLEEFSAFENIFEFYPISQHQKLKSLTQSRLNAIYGSENPSAFEMQAQHKLNKIIFLQHSISPIEWDRLPATLISTVDITQQYLAQQALEFSEQRFRDFANSASDWCWELDANLRVSYMSDTFTRLTGYLASEIVGATIKELFNQLSNETIKTVEELDRWYAHSRDMKSHKPFTNLEYQFVKEDGSPFVLTVSGRPLFNEDGVFAGYRGVSRDITVQKFLSEKLEYQASHDELTGLINRRRFESELNKILDDVHINNTEHVLLYLDLDRFKIVNDTCGHIAGDELLQQLAKLIKSVFDENDILGRLGGDEFAVVMRNCSLGEAMLAADKLHKKFDEFRFSWDGRNFALGVSIGVAKVSKASESVTQILQNADSACYMAKDNGKNNSHIFSENDEDISRRQGEMHWAVRITETIEKNDFTLFAQAIHPLTSTDNVFYELLIRMREDNHLILPGVFLPAAERFGLSYNIDKWVLKNALAWIRENRQILYSVKSVFINLSAKTIGQKNFLDFAIKMLDEYQVPPEKICFEITETSAIANLAEAVDFIQELKGVGCEFAIDDFGSGVSSFSYLKNLPVDYLKIDGMFIRDMLSNEVNLALVKSINEVCHVMGKKTIAEFVESDATLALLSNIGVDYAQGYAIGHPFPIEELALQ